MPQNTEALLPAPFTSSLSQRVGPARKLPLYLGKYSQDQLAPALQQSQFWRRRRDARCD